MSFARASAVAVAGVIGNANINAVVNSARVEPLSFGAGVEPLFAPSPLLRKSFSIKVLSRTI